jgi:hypothetical protein
MLPPVVVATVALASAGNAALASLLVVIWQLVGAPLAFVGECIAVIPHAFLRFRLVGHVT